MNSLFSSPSGPSGLLSALLVYACAVAQELPSTQPDLPRDAFRDFYQAVKDGQPGVVVSLCAASDPSGRKLVADLRAFAGAMKDLHAVVKAKFGADAVDVVSPQLASEEAIDAMRETTAKNTSRLEGDTVGPVEMIRIGGEWKLDISALLKSGGFGDNPDQYFTELTKIVGRTASDITSGKLATVQDAAEALMVRQSGIGENGATTQPDAATRA